MPTPEILKPKNTLVSGTMAHTTPAMRLSGTSTSSPSGDRLIGSEYFNPALYRPSSSPSFALPPQEAKSPVSVLSTQNITKNVIPQLKKDAESVITTDPEDAADEDTDLSFEPDSVQQQYLNMLDERRKMLKRSEREDIERISAGARRLEAEQRAINAANVGHISTALLGQGGAAGGQFRYSPAGSFSGKANEASYGVRQLADILGKENDAIAEVRSAYESEDYKLLNEKMTKLQDIRKERMDIQTKTAEDTRKAEQEALTEKEKREIEGKVLDQITVGVTDPVQIYNALGGSVPYDSITAITKTLAKPQTTTSTKLGGTGYTYKLTSAQQRDLIGAGFALDEIADIQEAVSTYGIDATLSAIDDPQKRQVVAEMFNALTQENEQMDTDTLISEIIDTATDEQIKSLKSVSDTAGTSSLWTSKKKDIQRLLETPEMRKQLELAISSGLSTEDIIAAILTSYGIST